MNVYNSRRFNNYFDTFVTFEDGTQYNVIVAVGNILDGIETRTDILVIQSYIDNYSFQENYDEALEEDEDNSDSKFIYDYLETVLSYQRKRKHEWDNEKKTVYSLFIKNN